jgi:hypothetical protein
MKRTLRFLQMGVLAILSVGGASLAFAQGTGAAGGSAGAPAGGVAPGSVTAPGNAASPGETGSRSQGIENANPANPAEPATPGSPNAVDSSNKKGLETKPENGPMQPAPGKTQQTPAPNQY